MIEINWVLFDIILDGIGIIYSDQSIVLWKTSFVCGH